MKRLYVINSPSYVDNHSSHTCGQTLIDEPLSEHFTYMYYNLAKFGLVDEVVIFPREGPHDKFKKEIDSRLTLDAPEKVISINWDRDRMVDVINEDKDAYVYSWSGYDVCRQLKKSYNIFSPVTVDYRNNVLSRDFHHFALIEGMSHERKYRLIPDQIPIAVCPLTSKKFTETSNKFTSNKKYDWIMVSSFDPRKRHIEFLRSISRNSRFRNTRGCIVARNPDNKGRIHAGHYVLKTIRDFSFSNIDIFLNVSNDTKASLLTQSKIFVCVSDYDFGPRAMIEAMQMSMPILSTPHMGACDWLHPGKNGEIVDSIDKCENMLYDMIDLYDSGTYSLEAARVSNLLKPDNIFPNIVKHIKNSSNR